MQMTTAINRIASVLLIVTAVILVALDGSAADLAKAVPVLLFIGSLIWFGDWWGSFVIMSHGMDVGSSPGRLVAGLGWCLLIGVPLTLRLLGT